MTRVTVKLFGQEARAVGRDEVSIQIDGEPTCAALRQKLSEAEPQLAPMLPAARFALNHEFAQEDTVVQADDEIALIGMVSGG